MCGGGESSRATIIGESSKDHSFPACIFFFEVERRSRAPMPFFRTANWDDCERAFPDELRVSAFPWWVPKWCLDSMVNPLVLQMKSDNCLHVLYNQLFLFLSVCVSVSTYVHICVDVGVKLKVPPRAACGPSLAWLINGTARNSHAILAGRQTAQVASAERSIARITCWSITADNTPPAPRHQPALT